MLISHLAELCISPLKECELHQCLVSTWKKLEITNQNALLACVDAAGGFALPAIWVNASHSSQPLSFSNLAPRGGTNFPFPYKPLGHCPSSAMI
uniref:Uncharacterized protein n=1 Tax=Anguilla anguilla TaxID=7936 RepID=A0A0E9PB48_ANGAN